MVRSRTTGKKARRGDGAADDGNLRLAGVEGGGGAHAGFRGAGGHSASGRSRVPSDVGVVGSASASASCSWASELASTSTSICCCFSAAGKATDSASGAGAVDDEAADEQAGAGAVVVLIGGSAGRTSAAVELISPAREITSGAAVGGCEGGGGETREGRADNAKNARR